MVINNVQNHCLRHVSTIRCEMLNDNELNKIEKYQRKERNIIIPDIN